MFQEKDVMEEFAPMLAALEKAFNEGDFDFIESCYTDDMVFMGQGAPTVTGKAEVAAHFKKLKDSGVVRLQLTMMEALQTSETRAYQVDNSLGYDKDGKVVMDNGRSIILWKKEQGKWLQQKEMLNTY